MRKPTYLMLVLVVFSLAEFGGESAFANTRAQQRQQKRCMVSCRSQQHLCESPCTSLTPDCKQNCGATYRSCIGDCKKPSQDAH
jgi:hypothetical protein